MTSRSSALVPLAVFLVVLLAALLAGPPGRAVAGEEPTSSPPSTLGEVLGRLGSGRPADVAWGAYLAGRDGHQDAIPALVDALRGDPQRQDDAWRFVHRAALDALIRLKAVVPEPLLVEYQRAFPVQTLALRADDPSRHAAALREVFGEWVGKREFGLQAVAVGNLLLMARPEGFARLLVADMPLYLRVRVYTPSPDAGLGGGTGAAGTGFGDSAATVPDGFPPYATYVLQADDRRGAALLAPGPRPVYLRRAERATSGLLVGGKVERFPANECRLEWLAALLDLPVAKLAMPSQDSILVGWTTPAAYQKTVGEARSRLALPYWALLRRLSEAHLLSAEEARTLRPAMDVVVTDDRTEKEPPLPGLPPLERP